MTRIKLIGKFSNLISLYSLQLTYLLASLVTIPILARNLGANSWGIVSAIQSLALTMVVIVEFGFGISGARTVASLKDDREKLSVFVANVQMIKVLLSVILLTFSVLIYQFVPLFHNSLPAYFWGTVFSIVNGFSLYWFFQGVQDLKYPVLFDVLGRSIYVIAIILFVHSSKDGWLVMFISFCSVFLPSVAIYIRLYKFVDFRLPSLLNFRSILQESFGLFVFRISVALYTSANIVVLGFFVNPTQVAIYASAERLVTLIKGGIIPITQVVSPRVSTLLVSEKSSAELLINKTFYALLLASILVSFLAWFLAPVVIPKIFGAEYVRSIDYFRILLISLPLTGVINVLGLQWLVPNRLDKPFNLIMIGGGVINIFTAIVLCPVFGIKGMVASVIITELIITVSLFLVAHTRKIAPFSFFGLLVDSKREKI